MAFFYFRVDTISRLKFGLIQKDVQPTGFECFVDEASKGFFGVYAPMVYKNVVCCWLGHWLHNYYVLQIGCARVQDGYMSLPQK